MLRWRLSPRVPPQDYARCASLRDEIAALRASDPLLSAKARLAAAVAAERWDEAAALRDAVKELSPAPPPPPLVPCSSECITAGVRVAVRSQYMREHSDLSRRVSCVIAPAEPHSLRCGASF